MVAARGSVAASDRRLRKLRPRSGRLRPFRLRTPGARPMAAAAFNSGNNFTLVGQTLPFSLPFPEADRLHLKHPDDTVQAFWVSSWHRVPGRREKRMAHTMFCIRRFVAVGRCLGRVVRDVRVGSARASPDATRRAIGRSRSGGQVARDRQDRDRRFGYPHHRQRFRCQCALSASRRPWFALPRDIRICRVRRPSSCRR